MAVEDGGGRKNCTKSLLAWWSEREASERAWKFAVVEVLRYDREANLVSADVDLRNPAGGRPAGACSTRGVGERILDKERRILALVEEIKVALEKHP